jgi:transcriptional regulator with XRE-family HTH domain
MDFYARVKQLAREKNHLSLQEFIISIGLNHDSYYSLKRSGNLPRTDESVKIAQALGVSVEYLVLGKNPRSSPMAEEMLNEISQLLEKYRKNTGRPVSRLRAEMG